MPLSRHAAKRLRMGPWLLVVLVVFVLAASVTSCGLLDTYRLEVKEYTFESPDLPPEFDGIRAVFVTDIHHGPYYSQTQVGKVVDLVNRLEPDLVLLGGDYVYHDTRYEATCFQELARLEAPLGCFAVLGNHDYGALDSNLIRGTLMCKTTCA